MAEDPRPGRTTCEVSRVEQVSREVSIVRLQPEDVAGAPAFRAGQYGRLGFQEEALRDFSFASRPDEPELEFHIRHIGSGASAYVAEQLNAGERVLVEGPYGKAWWREDHRGPIVCVAGGTGLAPMKSIVTTALARGVETPIHLYFGVRDECDLYCVDLFEELAERHGNLRFVPVLSEPSSATSRRTGLVGEVLRHDLVRFDGFKAYMAGPPVMVDQVMNYLLSAGLPESDIHADPFVSDAEGQRRRALGLA